jgi:hypothetical protein
LAQQKQRIDIVDQDRQDHSQKHNSHDHLKKDIDQFMVSKINNWQQISDH